MPPFIQFIVSYFKKFFNSFTFFQQPINFSANRQNRIAIKWSKIPIMQFIVIVILTMLTFELKTNIILNGD